MLSICHNEIPQHYRIVSIGGMTVPNTLSQSTHRTFNGVQVLLSIGTEVHDAIVRKHVRVVGRCHFGTANETGACSYMMPERKNTVGDMVTGHMN